jgi:hypothetical protein
MSPDQQLALGALALNTKIAVLLAAAQAKRQASAVAVPLASAGPTLHAEHSLTSQTGWSAAPATRAEQAARAEQATRIVYDRAAGIFVDPTALPQKTQNTPANLPQPEVNQGFWENIFANAPQRGSDPNVRSGVRISTSAPAPATPTPNKLMLAGGALAAAVGAWFLLR